MMKISPQFNRYFHAILNDILHSRKVIKVKGSEFSAAVDTNIASLEQLKMFFKMTDVKYRKTADASKYKNVFGTAANDDIVFFFGIPLSITELNNSELLRHVQWIQEVCAKNDLYIDSSQWDRLMLMAEKI